MSAWCVCVGGGISWQLPAPPEEEVSGYQFSHLSANTLRLLLKPTTNQINKLASGVWLPLFLTFCPAQPPCPACASVFIGHTGELVCFYAFGGVWHGYLCVR